MSVLFWDGGTTGKIGITALFESYGIYARNHLGCLRACFIKSCWDQLTNKLTN